MRRRRSKSVQPGVSLFPFLAVLICTLGVLIVLLVLAVKSASIQKDNQQQAVASNEAEKAAAVAAAAEARAQKKKLQQEAIVKLEDEIDLQILQAEGFASDRPKLRREVAKARDYRAHLEKEITEIEKQAQRLVDEMKLLDSDLSSSQTEVDDADLRKLNDRIAAAQEQLIQKRESIEVVEQKKFAIVPYRGAGGTERVPVFIECDRDGLTLQPFGITLTQRDFFSPVTAGNPIDAALAAVRNYYQEHELTKRDRRPYPLLVIRPGGDQAYGLARHSLVSWDDEFGYELVSQEKELEFGTVDPQLQQEIQIAVEKAKLTQVALRKRQAMMVGTRNGSSGQQFAGGGVNGGRPAGGMRSSSQRGGFVRESGGSRSGDSNQQVAYQDSRSEGQSKTNASRIKSEFNSDSAGSANDANANFANQSNRKSAGQSSSGQSSAGQGSAGPNSNGVTSPTANLANSRGANWALPTQTNGATGYVRPVTVVFSANSLTIRNVAGEAVTIPINGKPTQAIDKMVNIIWQRIDSWGIAGSSAYWKPNLSVVVEPGARDRFATLKQMLDGSGLGVEEASR